MADFLVEAIDFAAVIVDFGLFLFFGGAAESVGGGEVLSLVVGVIDFVDFALVLVDLLEELLDFGGGFHRFCRSHGRA